MGITVARFWLKPVLGALLVFGLWVSYRYSVASWAPESDMALPAMLWQGVHQHGLAFLRTFHFTPDSWLLSSVPLFFLLFAWFGDAPALVIALGWVILVATAGVAFLILRSVSGPVSGALAAIMILLSNRSAMGEVGFLTYPVSHNVSVLGGLIAVYSTMRWLASQEVWWLAATAIPLACVGVSDPWVQAAFTLPMVFACLWLSVDPRHAGSRVGARIAALTFGVVAIAIQTAGFGLLDFAPVHMSRLASPSGWLHSLDFLSRVSAVWFNILPGRDTAYPWTPGFVDIAVNTGALLLGTALVAMLALRAFGADPKFDLLWVAGAASCACMVGAYVALDIPKSMATGRYLMAAYVFAVMLFASALARHWPHISTLSRAAAVLYGSMLCGAGVASGVPVWASPQPVLRESGAERLAGFLQAQGLRYGFGSYWDSHANAVTWITRGAVVVRPVRFDPSSQTFAPRREQTSLLWYTPADAPANQSTFLALKAGWEDCQDVAACADAAERQFGPPQRVFHFQDARILVYDYPLLNADPEIRAAHAAFTPFGDKFGIRSPQGGRFLGTGWHSADANAIWSDAKAYALIRVPPGRTGAALITVDATVVAPSDAAFQDVTVSVRGEILAQWRITPGAPKSYSVLVPAAALVAGSAPLEFSTPKAVSARALSAGSDLRLGFVATAVQAAWVDAR